MSVEYKSVAGINQISYDLRRCIPKNIDINIDEDGEIKTEI